MIVIILTKPKIVEKRHSCKITFSFLLDLTSQLFVFTSLAKPISCHCSLSIPPKNVKIPLVF